MCCSAAVAIGFICQGDCYRRGMMNSRGFRRIWTRSSGPKEPKSRGKSVPFWPPGGDQTSRTSFCRICPRTSLARKSVCGFIWCIWPPTRSSHSPRTCPSSPCRCSISSATRSLFRRWLATDR
eukprot:Amastigsp_a189436_21.p3 type:complete len:123 gc:universal Amastigsp_a189436_21:562-194(-)